MRRLSLVLAAVLCLTGGAASALTVDEIVAKNLEARGGAAKLAAIKTLKATGKAVFGGGGFSQEAEIGVLQKRGGMIREETTLQGRLLVHLGHGRVPAC